MSDAKKILIIEDEKPIREIYELILKSAGYEVYSAKNGKIGLLEVTKNKPDLILLDLMMPVMDGAETFKQIRASKDGAKLPILILTNIGAIEVPKDLIDDYVLDVLVKVELTPDQLTEIVQKSLN